MFYTIQFQEIHNYSSETRLGYGNFTWIHIRKIDARWVFACENMNEMVEGMQIFIGDQPFSLFDSGHEENFE